MKIPSIIMNDKHATKLREGDKAPSFAAKDQNGKMISSADLKGKKIVLYFYPKDNTPGCTAESCDLKNNYYALQKQGYEVIGVSADDEKSHKKFADKYQLPFTLLADTDKKIILAYDVWGEKKFMGKTYDGIIRTTFIISEKGIIDKIITDVDTKNHTEQIIEK
ncbi:MAG: thioredoxin-dependent thiol peroxidase [Bacteroidia bacterium]